ncbi:MAG TPA: helix-turn-helix domain-containing protein, partial [Isosphaeraceae bacterium]|nr:helix-turn-helix domain-containing protein [Isosphaeraceae bacterium]
MINTEHLAGALAATRVEVLNPPATTARRRARGASVVVGTMGSGKEAGIVLQLLLDSEFALGVPGGPPAWAEVVRNALVHEGRLRSVVLKNHPTLDVESLLALLVEAFEDLDVPMVGSPAGRFTESELAELRREGVELSEPPAHGLGVAGRTAAEFAALMATALSVSEAAALLGVDKSRVRQRLAKGTLYGIKPGGAWRLPRFQFTSGGQVPGIDRVLQAVPGTLHPVAVQRWLTHP